jgi:Protein of unknown function (DUF3987)
VFQRLNRLEAARVGAEELTPQGCRSCASMPRGQERFDGGRADLEQRLHAEDDHLVLLSHLAKYRSLMPALALILHVIDHVDTGVGGPVSGVAAERAAAWCRYLEAHARRLYATGRTGCAWGPRYWRAGWLEGGWRARLPPARSIATTGPG